MTVDIVNYNNLTHSGLLNINILDNKNYSFNNIFIKDKDKFISIYNFLNTQEIYTITNSSINYNKCKEKGLYLIESPKNSKDNFIILRKINEDESELIANIDCNTNFIVIDNCKLYKAGSFNGYNIDKTLYYCYKCGKYIYK